MMLDSVQHNTLLWSSRVFRAKYKCKTLTVTLKCCSEAADIITLHAIALNVKVRTRLPNWKNQPFFLHHGERVGSDRPGRAAFLVVGSSADDERYVA